MTGKQSNAGLEVSKSSKRTRILTISRYAKCAPLIKRWRAFEGLREENISSSDLSSFRRRATRPDNKPVKWLSLAANPSGRLFGISNALSNNSIAGRLRESRVLGCGWSASLYIVDIARPRFNEVTNIIADVG